MDRKPLPKSLRFEILKRDRFTCQYCGGKAPEVLLHVDHIIPVVAGGADDAYNLIASCQACNLGKGKRSLDDQSILEKQQAAYNEKADSLRLLQDRKEQLEMLIEWQKELNELSDLELVCVNSFILNNFPQIRFTDKNSLKPLLNKYGLSLLLEALKIASCKDFDSEINAIKYTAAICRNKVNQKNGM